MNKFQHISQLSQDHKKWFAIYTKYKCEKYVVKALIKKGVEAYIPLLKKTKKYTRKIVVSDLPLINCYVFVNITTEQYLKVLETEYVSRFIKQRNDLIAIPNEEINLLKQIVGEYQDNFVLCNDSLVLGSQVEVIAGSLTGIKGFLVEIKNKKEFVVQLDHLGILLRINIGSQYLKPIARLNRSLVSH